MSRWWPVVLGAFLGVPAAASPEAGAAQSLAERIASAPDGAVRMEFAAREDVCGDGRSIRVRSSSDRYWESVCEDGPVRVRMHVRDGRVRELDSYVGGRWRSAREPVTDLGAVGAPQAAEFLISLAATSEGRVAKAAVLPAVLADTATVWPALLRIARDGSRPRDVRKAAVFWVGQAAADRATEGLGGLVGDEGVDVEVREHAVFALSERPDDEAVPALIEIARGSESPRLRRRALFWLAQFGDDPRALGLFEEILTAR